MGSDRLLNAALKRQFQIELIFGSIRKGKQKGCRELRRANPWANQAKLFSLASHVVNRA
jgi:hypothetical protein